MTANATEVANGRNGNELKSNAKYEMNEQLAKCIIASAAAQA